jgi:hypothetical protein
MGLGFRLKRRESQQSPEQMPHDMARTAADHEERTGSTAFIPRVIDVRSIEQLLRTRELRSLFQSGLVFVHAKKPSSDHLLNLVRSSLSGTLVLRRVAASSADVDTLVPRSRHRASRASRPRVLLLDVEGAVESAERIIAAHVAVRPRKGLWVLGDPPSINISTLRAFDAFLLFDMADEHLQRLRSVVPLPADLSQRLQNSVWDDGQEGVLVLIAADTLWAEKIPRLRQNPAFVRLRDDDNWSPSNYGYPQ